MAVGELQLVAGEDRTHDLRIMRPTRCQLRYCHCASMTTGKAGRVADTNIHIYIYIYIYIHLFVVYPFVYIHVHISGYL